MRIMALGKTLAGDLLYPPFEHAAFADRLTKAFRPRTAKDFGFLGDYPEAVPVGLDERNPLQAGWTFVVASNDPQRHAYIEALQPLAVRRGMSHPTQPLEFNAGDEEWSTWLRYSYFGADLQGSRPPRYVLLVGGPDVLPFRFQAFLDCVVHVGRLAFERIEDLQAYVQKVLRLEDAEAPVVDREVLLFAPDGGNQDPTHYSCNYMVRPLADHIASHHRASTTRLFAQDATKSGLMQRLHSSRPAIVYTASHGLHLRGESLSQQQRYNGAICCQGDGPLTLDDLLCADDVPREPFLEGAVWFQFACYGYGTPAMSDYAHWIDGKSQMQAQRDFIAALPMRLLAHPRGPLAHIAHVDTAFVHAFADPNEPHARDRWDQRMSPFVSAVDHLLELTPSAYAMQRMNETYIVANDRLTDVYDRHSRGLLKWTPQMQQRFVDDWIFRTDAQNYLVLGDPAVRLRIPATHA